MQRIMILGSSGSGKSTLARQLSGITGIPAFYMDGLRFTENWVLIPKDEFRAKQSDIVSKESWIFEGNTLSTLEQRIDRADTIVFIDYNRFFCIYRIVKRRVQIRKKPRLELPQGCKDKIDREFLSWVWNYPKRSRPKIIKAIYASGKTIYHLKTRKQVREFILLVGNLS